MKKLKNKIAFVLLFILVSAMSQAKGLDPRFQILPLPQNIEILKGQGIAGSELAYIVSKGESKIPVLGTLLDALSRIEKQGAGITLSLSEQNTPESPEGYTLEITSRGVTLQSRGQAGLFYGCQTLEQLMEDSRDLRIPIPCLRMTDYPEISYRAVHFDTKHHLDRTEYYYRIIDKLARQGNPKAFTFSKPHIPDYNYSFSGLKTSFLYSLRDWLKEDPNFIEHHKNDLAASLEATIVDIQMDKLRKVAKALKINEIAVAGGVSANNGLRNSFHEHAAKYGWNIYIPKFSYTTDNAAMIAITGYYKYLDKDFCTIDKPAYSRVTI